MSDLLWFLKEGRHIFSVCPECGQVHRLSDLQLSVGDPYVPDWLDQLDDRRAGLAKELSSLNEQAGELRRKAKEMAERTVLPERLRSAAPVFAGLEVDVRDVRTILDPVEYVAFKGMNSVDGVREISLICTGEPRVTVSTIEDALKRGDMRWNTVRLGDDGLITESKAG